MSWPIVTLVVWIAMLFPGRLPATEVIPAVPAHRDQEPTPLQYLQRQLQSAGFASLKLDNEPWARQRLSRDEAEQARRMLLDAHRQWIRDTRAAEMRARELVYEDFKLKFAYTVYGDKPETGRSLFISLHGGGGTTAQVNDRQWANQQRLYQPAEGVYLCPRAPTDTWNLWHQGHIDHLFTRLIENLIVLEDVNPNRVYVMGYSAGGDGVYQIGPRMGDSWAAAAMMAGHPNESTAESLRNTPFTLHIGTKDRAYNRNQVALVWKARLKELHAADPDGYVHEVHEHDTGHWMDGRDVVAVPWMAQFTRQPRPRCIVWKQDDVIHDRFYWIRVARECASGGQMLRAERSGNTIKIDTQDVGHMELMLDDEMLDLDRTVTVVANGQTVFQGTVPRTIQAMAASLFDRGDPQLVFTATLTVDTGVPAVERRP